MAPGFASAAPRKLSAWGEGGLLANNKKSRGKPKVGKHAVSGHRWVSPGEGASRSGLTQGEGEPGHQGAVPLPTALGKCAEQDNHRAAPCVPAKGPLGSWTYLHIDELLPRRGPSTPDCIGLTPGGGPGWLCLHSTSISTAPITYLPHPLILGKKKKPIKITILCLQICRSFSLMKDA